MGFISSFLAFSPLVIGNLFSYACLEILHLLILIGVIADVTSQIQG